MSDLELQAIKLMKNHKRLSPSLICRLLKVGKKSADEIYFFCMRRNYLEAQKLKKALEDGM